MLGSAGLAAQNRPRQSGIEDVLDYIADGWNTLTRSLNNCQTFSDPKIQERAVLYLPAEMPISLVLSALQAKCNIRIEHLPSPIARLGTAEVNSITPPGLLFLEHSYVVPGGRFNEMYGWDSYFIILGLLRDGRIDLARGMVENFLFEIEHYGAVLNANRTYYLTRSQPPFLTSMIMAVYDAEKKTGKDDLTFLSRAYADARKDYDMWVSVPHLAGATGLSRYFAFGEGPVPEEEGGYYHGVLRDLVRRLNTDYLEPQSSLPPQPVPERRAPDWPVMTVYLCAGAPASFDQNACARTQTVGLSGDFYEGDRSMRESGFDISFRFGLYGAETHHYAPVCLNSLLYKTEKDMEQLSLRLGKTAEAREWAGRAAARRARIQQYFWDEQRGLFVDYNFQTQQRSTYEYATTFYPLWAGLATPEQAAAVAGNLVLFEQAGGLAASRRQTGMQWDYPYGWAPLQLLAAEGLRRYGFEQQANRISYEWLSTILETFRREGSIREKYNVVTRSSETPVVAGYKTNVIGFGWTNGVFLELLAKLPPPMLDRLKNEGAKRSRASGASEFASPVVHGCDVVAP
jgi:alpha,alpha-trehalase